MPLSRRLSLPLPRHPPRHPMRTTRPKSHAVSNPKGSGSATAERLTRTDVARILAVSPASVRRMEDKELHPTRDADGVHIFNMAEVTRVAQERSRRAVDPTKEGERDARAFELLDAGHDIRHLVTTLRISVDVAKRIVSAWLEVGQRDVVVPRACKPEIEQCLGRFRNADELIQRARAAANESEHAYEEFHQAQTRLSNLVAFIGELAARSAALAEVVPEVRERLDGELAQVLDCAFKAGTTQLVSAAPRAPIAPGAVGEFLAEVPNTTSRPADGEAAAGAADAPAVAPRGVAASTDVSTTEVSVNDDRAGRSAVGEPVAAVPRGCESMGEPVSGPRAVDGQSGPEPASGIGAAAGAASGIRDVRSPREQLLDAWLTSLADDDVRLLRLAALLKREELEMFAELERGIGIEVAPPTMTGSRSPREHLADALLVSLTEDEARLDQIGALLTASELDMLARLGRGCETAAAMAPSATSRLAEGVGASNTNS